MKRRTRKKKTRAKRKKRMNKMMVRKMDMGESSRTRSIIVVLLRGPFTWRVPRYEESCCSVPAKQWPRWLWDC
jgi:hypothetical protein